VKPRGSIRVVRAHAPVCTYPFTAMHCVMPKQKFMQLNNVFINVAVVGFSNFDLMKKITSSYYTILKMTLGKAMKFAEVGKHKKLPGAPFVEIYERKIITDPRYMLMNPP
jgi:hypothetical protein